MADNPLAGPRNTGGIYVKPIYENWPGAGKGGTTLKGGLRINVFPNFTGILQNFLAMPARGQAWLHAGVAGAEKEAQRILELCLPDVPVDSMKVALQHNRLPGQLKASGRVEPVDMSAKWAYVNIVFGGPAGAGGNKYDVDYAWIMHEDVFGYSPYLSGKPHWLSDVILKERLDQTPSINLIATVKETVDDWAAQLKEMIENGYILPYVPKVRYNKSDPAKRNAQEAGDAAAESARMHERRAAGAKKAAATRKANAEARASSLVKQGVAHPHKVQTAKYKKTKTGQIVTEFKPAGTPKWATKKGSAAFKTGQEAAAKANQSRNRPRKPPGFIGPWMD
jgi:hypothetical protein